MPKRAGSHTVRIPKRRQPPQQTSSSSVPDSTLILRQLMPLPTVGLGHSTGMVLLLVVSMPYSLQTQSAPKLSTTTPSYTSSVYSGCPRYWEAKNRLPQGIRDHVVEEYVNLCHKRMAVERSISRCLSWYLNTNTSQKKDIQVLDDILTLFYKEDDEEKNPKNEAAMYRSIVSIKGASETVDWLQGEIAPLTKSELKLDSDKIRSFGHLTCVSLDGKYPWSGDSENW
ncbi:hypothetical protein BDD12DRAFT_899201 [Trichophaea hybrida]|nr:hypothetical protein BDD12DRAFT_899201 [Trichophaea hybrida]